MLQFLKKTNVHKVFFFLYFYLETYTMTKKHNIMYTYFPPVWHPLAFFHKTHFISERKHLWWIQVSPNPPPYPKWSLHKLLHSLFTSLLNLSVYVLEEDLLIGTQCPYGFLSATLSALEVTLLPWTLGCLMAWRCYSVNIKRQDQLLYFNILVQSLYMNKL